jgi:hypothetical protein
MRTITEAAVKAQRQNTALRLDVADYIGPVVAAVDGLVTTTAIRAGTLLFAENAVAATFERDDGYEVIESESRSGESHHKNWVTNVVAVMHAIRHDRAVAS